MKRLLLVLTAAIALVALTLTGCSGPRLLNSVTLNPDRATSITRNLAYGELERQRLDLYRPDSAGPHPVLVYFHGGGWEWGSKEEYAFVGKRFAAEGYLVAMVNYRLTPEGAWPVFMEDVAASIAWVHDHAADYGGDPDRLYTAGHSAGGYNAVMVAVAPEFLGAYGKSTDIIRGVAGISGPYDFLPLDVASSKATFGKASDLEATQPVNRVTADAPPMILLYGQKDDVVLQRNIDSMERALNDAGVRVERVIYPEADHADTVIAIAWPRRLPVVEDITRFFESLD
ncbi:alpha/beta hydrolase [Parvularcula marina]|uniref:Alpha/beta hydrolase n=1 Tax=Parvularcula marina TaxID=2292771 RepID=A0A371RHM5_9PROT|nr:alpha/beta hydrolase [Parvularcula marina]RFB04956.1 alpha/beta hydrolase [Parvularcula marina]